MRGELQGKQVVQVAAGDKHSGCVTKDSSVYMWGDIDNEQGQLGQEDIDDAHVLKLTPEGPQYRI